MDSFNFQLTDVCGVKSILKKKDGHLDFGTEISTHGENESKVLVLYTGLNFLSILMYSVYVLCKAYLLPYLQVGLLEWYVMPKEPLLASHMPLKTKSDLIVLCTTKNILTSNVLIMFYIKSILWHDMKTSFK